MFDVGAPSEEPNNANIAGGVGLGAEIGDIVDVDALAGDRIGVEEGLVAVRRLTGPVAAEVLVVDERRRIVGANEI